MYQCLISFPQRIFLIKYVVLIHLRCIKDISLYIPTGSQGIITLHLIYIMGSPL